jgi:hypothetical protein
MTDAELERAYFARGKEILGASAGGALARMRRAKGGLVAAELVLLTAATKQDPREYFMAALRAAERRRSPVGIADSLAIQAAEQMAERRAYEGRPPTSEERARVADIHAAYRRTHNDTASPQPFVSGLRGPTGHGARVMADIERRRGS